MKGHSDIYTAIFEQRKKKSVRQIDINKILKKQPQNFWASMKRGSTKLNEVVQVCDFLELKMYVVNEETMEMYEIKSHE